MDISRLDLTPEQRQRYVERYAKAVADRVAENQSKQETEKDLEIKRLRKELLDTELRYSTMIAKGIFG